MLQASGSDSGVFVVFPLTLLVQNTRPCIPQPYHDKGKMPLCRLRVPLCGHDGQE